MDGALLPQASYSARTRGLITISYFGCFASVGVCLASLGPILLSLSQQLQVDKHQLGILFVARSIGYLVGACVSGWLVDRLHRTHLMLVVTMLLCATGTAAIPISTSFALTAVAVSQQGFCMGVLDTGGNVLLIWLHGSAKVEPYMQAMHFCFGFGAFVAPLCINLSVAQTGGISYAFFGLSTMLALWSIPLSFHRGPRKPPAGSEAAAACNAASEDSSKLEQQAQVELTEVSKEVAPESTAQSTKGIATSRMNHVFIGMSAFTLLIYVGAEVAFGGYIFSYAVQALGMNDSKARLINSSFWGWLAAGRLLAVPLSTRLSSATMLVVCLSGSFVCAFAFAVCPLPWLTTAGFGLFMAPIFPSVITNAERVISVTGAITTCFVVSAAFGEMLLPLIVSLCFELSYETFPKAIFIATIMQLLSFAVAYQAARKISKSNTPSPATQSSTMA